MNQDLEATELAEMAGITVGYLRKIELGHSPRCSVKIYRALRVALGLSREDGVYIRGNPGPVLDDASTDDGDAA